MVNGVKVGLAPSANNLVVANSTILVQTPVPSGVPQFAVGNEVVTANSASQYVIHGQTLVPGASAVTVDRTLINLAPHATPVVVGGSSIGLERAKVSLPTVMVDGQIITANSADQYVVAGHTITPGAPAVTILGIPISIPVDLQPTRAIQGIITAGSKAYPHQKHPNPEAHPSPWRTDLRSSRWLERGYRGTSKTEALAYTVAPKGSAAFHGSYVFTSSAEFNSSTAARAAGATGSATLQSRRLLLLLRVVYRRLILRV